MKQRRDLPGHQLDDSDVTPSYAPARTSAVASLICAADRPRAAAAGSGGGTVSVPTVAPAKTYSLQGFQPAAPGRARAASDTLSFTIQQPSGKPLTATASAASRTPASI